ncbi:MAG: hypothetical protein E7526_02460 [Ruminococcaceae bacterium]|nr:hypothetical protein [Oscillospiraceae bacterium]
MRIFDLHCDTLSAVANGYTTVEKSMENLKKGNIKAQCFAAFSKSNTENAEFLKQSEIFKEFEKSSDFKAILTAENIGFTKGEISEIEKLKNVGVKAVSLTHNTENKLAYPNSPNRDIHLKGLKPAGVTAVEYMDSVGITLDVSHLNMGGFYDASRICRRPIIATHSCCNAIYPHSRNLYDSQLRIIARGGGIIGVCFYSRFLNGTDSMSAEDVVRTARHIANIAGIDSVALGSDFDGMENKNGLNSSADFVHLIDSLNRYFTAAECDKICYKNAERIFTC